MGPTSWTFETFSGLAASISFVAVPVCAGGWSRRARTNQRRAWFLVIRTPSRRSD